MSKTPAGRRAALLAAVLVVAVLTVLAVVTAAAAVPVVTTAAFALLALAVGLRSRRTAPRRRRRRHGVRPSPPGWPLERVAVPDPTAPTWTKSWPVLPPPEELSRVRQGVGALLIEWNIGGEAAQPTLLVVTELLTNAIEHGDAPIRATLALTPPVMLVQVLDGAPQPPRRRGGYGLAIVEELAVRRGWFPEHDGKTVWAEVPLGWADPPPSG